jgi:cytochrome c oxidase assembly protein subunit 15
MLVGVSGAVAALGDTLFPSQSLADALRSDLSASSHVLVRLRLVHPAVALIVAALLVAGAFRFPLRNGDTWGRAAAWLVATLAIVQVGAGFANVMLLAPVWMQLVHLLIADALWIAFVILGASSLATGPVAAASAPGVRRAAV